MNKALPTLRFQHVFKNGMCVDLTVIRFENTAPKIISSKTKFHTPENVAEYNAWVEAVSNSLVDDGLLTPGEIEAAAVKYL